MESLDNTTAEAVTEEKVVSPAEAEPTAEPTAEPKKAKKAKKVKKAKKSKKKIVLLIVLLLVFFLIIAPVGAYFGTYFLAVKNAKDGNFETADKLLLIKPLTNLHDNILLIYVDAGTLKDNGKPDEAAMKFYSISSYEDSLELAKNCSRKYADKLIKKDKFDEALAWSYQVSGYDTELGKAIELEARYHIAANKLADYSDYSGNEIITISNELKSIYDQGYTDAYDAYAESQAGVALYYATNNNYDKALSIVEPYKDATPKATSLYTQVQAIIFDHAVSLYYEGEFASASDFFTKVITYSNADSYRAVCDDLNFAATSANYTSYLKDAFEYYDVPDVGYLIFKNSDIADRFFLGEWRSGSTYYRLEKGQNGNTFYTNIPLIDYKDNERFYYKDNVFCVGTSWSSANRPCFTFYVNSYNEISIYCEKDGRTYNLYRQ